MNPLYQLLAHTAHSKPDQLAIADEWGELTWNGLWKETESLKNAIAALNVGKGTGLCILTGNNRNFVMALYAGLGNDAVTMPMSKQSSASELESALTEAQLHFLLSDSPVELNVLLKSTIKTSTGLFYVYQTQRVLGLVTAELVPGAALMRFTSGTTGKARCIVLSSRSAMERIDAAIQGLDITGQDRVIWVLPMPYHFIVSILLYVKVGASIIVCQDFLAASILQRIQHYGGTWLYASPMHIRLLGNCPENIPIPTLKKVISTTASISTDACKTFQERYNIPVTQAFGIIEVGLPLINASAHDHPESVGYPLPAYEVSLFDGDMNVLPPGQVGLLGLKGPGMFDAYLVPPTLRKDVLKNGWFLTGDYAWMGEDGRLEIKGREKSMINVAGNKVFPDEVEGVLEQCPGIIRARVFGRTHPLMGEIVVAETVTAHPMDPESIIRFCKDKLISFKVPQRILFVDKIDLTGSGKVKRSP